MDWKVLSDNILYYFTFLLVYGENFLKGMVTVRQQYNPALYCRIKPLTIRGITGNDKKTFLFSHTGSAFW